VVQKTAAEKNDHIPRYIDDRYPNTAKVLKNATISRSTSKSADTRTPLRTLMINKSLKPPCWLWQQLQLLQPRQRTLLPNLLHNLPVLQRENRHSAQIHFLPRVLRQRPIPQENGDTGTSMSAAADPAREDVVARRDIAVRAIELNGEVWEELRPQLSWVLGPERRLETYSFEAYDGGFHGVLALGRFALEGVVLVHVICAALVDDIGVQFAPVLVHEFGNHSLVLLFDCGHDARGILQLGLDRATVQSCVQAIWRLLRSFVNGSGTSTAVIAEGCGIISASQSTAIKKK
jgi:hypothetical protein